MAIYSLGQNTTVTTTGAASADIKAASTNSPRIMEVGINLITATASTYGFGRPANSGSATQTSPVLVLAENPADPTGLSGCAVAWSVAPTVPTNFARRVGLPATAGAGIIWTFPRGFTLAASGQAVIWNLATNSASMNFWFVVDE
jgi:hypothetical protein